MVNNFVFIRYLVIQRSIATKDLGCIHVDVLETLRYALSDKWRVGVSKYASTSF